MKAAILLTCHNRINKTINCVKGLIEGNETPMEFVIVDDGSTDGTVQALVSLNDEIDHRKASISILNGDGSLFYSGGMRKAMEYAQREISADYFLLINDDVSFDEKVIDNIIEQKRGLADIVFVGATRNSEGKCSYGGIKYNRGIHYSTVSPSSPDRSCDTFNANFVFIPKEIFVKVPIMDSHYKHSLGDFDYGLSIKKCGYRIEVLEQYVGVCENNSSAGTWLDTSLSRRERIKKKESVKGAPAGQWFYYLKKNFGLGKAIVSSITPYVRIIIVK